jgi:hypothetical protein
MPRIKAIYKIAFDAAVESELSSATIDSFTTFLLSTYEQQFLELSADRNERRMKKRAMEKCHPHFVCHITCGSSMHRQSDYARKSGQILATNI